MTKLNHVCDARDPKICLKLQSSHRLPPTHWIVLNISRLIVLLS